MKLVWTSEHLNYCFSCELTELYDQMLFIVFRCWSVTGNILVVSGGDNNVRVRKFLNDVLLIEATF